MNEYRESQELLEMILDKHGEIHRRESSGEEIPEDELLVLYIRMRNVYSKMFTVEQRQNLCEMAFEVVNDFIAKKRRDSGRTQLVAYPGNIGYFKDLLPGITIADYVGNLSPLVSEGALTKEQFDGMMIAVDKHELTKVGK